MSCLQFPYLYYIRKYFDTRLTCSYVIFKFFQIQSNFSKKWWVHLASSPGPWSSVLVLVWDLCLVTTEPHKHSSSVWAVLLCNTRLTADSVSSRTTCGHLSILHWTGNSLDRYVGLREIHPWFHLFGWVAFSDEMCVAHTVSQGCRCSREFWPCCSFLGHPLFPVSSDTS